MRTHGMRQSHAYLERMLDGGSARQDSLAKLLAAARAPEKTDPAGLAAALTAFRAASADRQTSPTRRNSMIKNLAAKLLAAKFLAVAGVAAAATGGMAAAASTGHLPSPLPHSSHASGTAVAAVDASTDESSSSASASDSATASASPTASSEPTDAQPSPSLRGLCQAWLSKPHEHGKADTSAAFSVLVSTAGGTDAVDSYCTSLLGPSAAPSTSHSGGKPSTTHVQPSTGSSASHPDGKPSAVPSPSHPGGKPSPLPTPTRH